jgi:hypothetical protein
VDVQLFEGVRLMKYHYTLIFRGRYSVNVRIDTISEEYLRDLRSTPEDELFYKMYDENYGDELSILGISPLAGCIEVFNDPGRVNHTYEQLGKPIITLQGDASGTMSMSIDEPAPRPNSIVAGCVSNQDGIMGHVILNLDEPFDVEKLSVIYTSAEKFNTDSAINGILYQNGKQLIKEYIDESYYLDTVPKVEFFFCSHFDENLKETPLFSDHNWL